MAKGEFEALTPNGTPLPLAVSALTKYLRRDREVHALFWAKQIERRYWKYLWRRLCLVAAEDVGIADPLAIVIVNSLAQAYARHREESSKPTPDGALLAMAVMYLARAPKSREADDFDQAVAHLQSDEGWEAPIPDYALDLHTPEGKERPDRLRHWVDVASHVENRRGLSTGSPGFAAGPLAGATSTGRPWSARSRSGTGKAVSGTALTATARGRRSRWAG